MDGDDVVRHLIITGVKFTDRELDRGAFGRIFVVDYDGVNCAAKEINPVLLEIANESDQSKLKQDFLQECLLHSKLHHPNIVKMLGVYYRNHQAVLPVLVMELMECGTLTRLLENYQNIPMYVKLSILQDVSRAIHYLHTLNPAILHRDLTSNNVLLTARLTAKVCDFIVMKVISPLSSDRLTQAPGTTEFMPPEVFSNDPQYGLPLDVFSFGCVVCHVITQQWPTPSPSVIKDPETGKLIVPEVERRQRYIDQISEESLKQLVIICLDNDQERRPPISVVSKRITSIITG